METSTASHQGGSVHSLPTAMAWPVSTAVQKLIMAETTRSRSVETWLEPQAGDMAADVLTSGSPLVAYSHSKSSAAQKSAHERQVEPCCDLYVGCLLSDARSMKPELWQLLIETKDEKSGRVWRKLCDHDFHCTRKEIQNFRQRCKDGRLGKQMRAELSTRGMTVPQQMITKQRASKNAPSVTVIEGQMMQRQL